MAYTTDTTDFNPTLNDYFEEAFERCNPFGKVKSRDDRDIDFGDDAEQAERQALRLIEVGVGFGVAPVRLPESLSDRSTAAPRASPTSAPPSAPPSASR